MDKKVTEVLEKWHEHYNDEANQYSEFEPSDIEYFVGCMLYNHFAFSKAHHNMKTMDLSYDFLSSCGDELYDDAKENIASITFEKEEDALALLQAYIKESKEKYSEPECYLLNRLDGHVKAMAERYAKGVEITHVDFVNPLER